MSTDPADPLLLTPGPLNISAAAKAAMLRDWGSRHEDFIELTARLRSGLLAIAGVGGDYVAVPMQGAGTFAVEASIGTLVPPTGKLLVLANGVYGRRMAEIAQRLGRTHEILEGPEDRAHDPERLARILARDSAVTHVAVVHCETSTGLLNSLDEIAHAAAGRGLIVDAMSSFGAIAIDAEKISFDALISSANKCLEGAPGLAFVIARRAALEDAAGNASSLSLDLHAQWRSFETDGQWRFTPPTHVVAALAQALAEHEAEGGVAGRGARYRRNLAALVSGMRGLGFEPYLPEEIQAPVIVAFRMPADPKFDFAALYGGLAGRGVIIYPGSVSSTPTFRMGCIGQVDVADIERAVAAVADCLREMGVASTAPYNR